LEWQCRQQAQLAEGGLTRKKIINPTVHHEKRKFKDKTVILISLKVSTQFAQLNVKLLQTNSIW
jgi:hypothetical protein